MQTLVRAWPSHKDKYEIGEAIGKTTTGKVYAASCPEVGCHQLAIKIIDIDKLTAPLEQLQQRTNADLSHVNVIKFRVSFVAGQELWIVMEMFCCGSCFSILSHSGHGLNEIVIASILKDAISGLQYLHGREQMHRDLKAAHILVRRSGSAALAGLCTLRELIDSGERDQARTYVGTLQWMAPEVLEQTGEYGVKADIWSFGMTALELAYGKVPLQDQPAMKVMMERLNSPPPEAPANFSENFRDMVKSCLHKEAALRPTAQALAGHRFFMINSEESAELVRRNMLRLPSLAERFRMHMAAANGSTSQGVMIQRLESVPPRFSFGSEPEPETSGTQDAAVVTYDFPDDLPSKISFAPQAQMLSPGQPTSDFSFADDQAGGITAGNAGGAKASGVLIAELLGDIDRTDHHQRSASSGSDLMDFDMESANSSGEARVAGASGRQPAPITETPGSVAPDSIDLGPPDAGPTAASPTASNQMKPVPADPSSPTCLPAPQLSSAVTSSSHSKLKSEDLELLLEFVEDVPAGRPSSPMLLSPLPKVAMQGGIIEVLAEDGMVVSSGVIPPPAGPAPGLQRSPSLSPTKPVPADDAKGETGEARKPISNGSLEKLLGSDAGAAQGVDGHARAADAAVTPAALEAAPAATKMVQPAILDDLFSMPTYQHVVTGNAEEASGLSTMISEGGVSMVSPPSVDSMASIFKAKENHGTPALTTSASASASAMTVQPAATYVLQAVEGMVERNKQLRRSLAKPPGSFPDVVEILRWLMEDNANLASQVDQVEAASDLSESAKTLKKSQSRFAVSDVK
jgi:serine/threonine-protein kinase OSR1/STK39